MWRPTKEEIRHWLETKEHEFSKDQNKNLLTVSEQWLQRYVFKYLHEIFFVDFSNVLTKWVHRLAKKNETFHTVVPRNWTLELI
jgi:hypothetical protein